MSIFTVSNTKSPSSDSLTTCASTCFVCASIKMSPIERTLRGVKSNRYTVNDVSVKSPGIYEGSKKKRRIRRKQREETMGMQERRTTCKRCGKAIQQIKGRRARQYCSDACRVADYRHRTASENKGAGKDEEKQPGKNLKFQAAIRKMQEIETPFVAELMPPREETAALAVRLTVREMESAVGERGIQITSFGYRIFLVGGGTSFSGKIDQFAGSIPYSMQPLLMSGESFAFCNNAMNRLALLKWDGNRFNLLYMRTERTTFPWPRSHEKDRIIEVTADEFRAILLLPAILTCKQERNREYSKPESEKRSTDMILY